MSLRRKTLLIFLIAITVLIGAAHVASRMIVLRGFASLEERIVRDNVTRALNALSDDIAVLDTLVGDWAGWDDTYAFIRDTNTAYIQSNLVDQTFSQVKVDAMLFVDSAGRLVFAKAYDRTALAERPVPDGLLTHVLEGAVLTEHRDADSSIAGLLLTPEGLMAVASRPILPSSKEGDIRGSLIMARYLDAAEIERLARTTVLSLALYRADDPLLPAEIHQIRTRLSPDSPLAVRPLSSESIGGYALLTDIYARPSVVMRIEMPRDVYKHGAATTTYFMFALVFVGAIFTVLLVTHLDRLVLRRVANLNAAVAAVGASGDLSSRVPVEGNDEMGSLAQSINAMLQALQDSQRAVEEATARYRQLFAEVQTGVLVIDATTHRIMDANPAAVRLLGGTREEIIGQDCHAFCAGQGDPCAHVTDSAMTQSEGFIHTMNGTQLPVVRTAATVTLNGQPHVLESIVDISERKRHEEWLTNLAYQDPLTHTANRRALEDHLERALGLAREGRPGALLWLDLDGFKLVNDTLGHLAGDEALVMFAKTLRDCLRSDDLLARVGGDEFAVLLQRTDVVGACTLAERLRRAIEGSPVTVQGRTFALTTSVGVVALDGSLSVRDTLARVDAAMYRAKHSGRNRVEVG